MQRDPQIKLKEKYFKHLYIKEITPKFFWTRCCKCGLDFKKEKMYEASYLPYVGETIFVHSLEFKNGCTHCFSSIEEFRKYLVDKEYILTEKDF